MTPTSALVDKTPHEVWTGKKPSLSHLRVFGCDAFVHVPKDKRNKMDSKAEKCIFIGYKDGVKGYKLWNPVKRKTVYSRDVIFREVENTSRIEDVPKEKEPDKLQFDIKDERGDSFEESYSSESDEEAEPQTPVLRRSDRVRRQAERYSPPDFRSNFVLSITDDDPRTAKEAMDSDDSKLW